MIDLREVRSVTDFQRNAKQYAGKLKKTGTPLDIPDNEPSNFVVNREDQHGETTNRR